MKILGLLGEDREHRYPDCQLTLYAGVPVAETIPKPTFTNPRLRQLHRILGDLHYLATDAKETHLTSDGRDLIAGIQWSR